MNVQVAKLLSSVALCLSVGVPMARGGDIKVSQVKDQYKILVDSATVNQKATLVLVWDTEDRGEKFDDWPQSRIVATDLNASGGEFSTPLEGIPEGSVVRVFARYDVRRLKDGGYVELSGNQYFVTDVKENEATGMEMTFVMMGGADWCPLIAGTHDGFTIGRNNGYRNSVYIRCHDGNEISRPSFTEGGVTTISLQRGGNEGKTGVLCVNGNQVTTKDYSEPFVLYAKGASDIHLGTSVFRSNFTNCRWYSVKLWGLDGSLVREYVPACFGDAPCLYDTVKKTWLLSAGTGSATKSGELAEEVVGFEVAKVSAPAEAVDPKLVVKATWTGEAGTGELFNPANWNCINLLDEKVDDGVPGAATEITLTGEINLCIAENQVLTGRVINTVNATLKDDVVWLGHVQTSAGRDVFPVGSVIELNGHDMTLAGHYVETANQWTICNSAEGEPATLRVVTAEGQVNENRNTWLKGNLRLEKRGVGTYVAHTQKGNDGSNFTGGTYLVEGVTKLADGTWWRAFGGDTKIIHIGPNATLDTAGTYHICNTPIYLDGGTILQSGGMNDQKDDSFGNITLTADSTFRATANTVINTIGSELWAALIDLGGHTLTVDVADSCYLDIGKLDVTNGLVKMVGKGKFRTDGQNYHRVNAPMADFDIESKLIELYSNVSVRNFTCRATDVPEWGDTSKFFTVSGTFRPVTRNFTKVCLLDGATLSLVDQTGSWSVDSSSTEHAEYRVVFPETGTIYVDVTGRTDISELAKSPSPYLVKWNEGEVPTGVRFKIVGAPREGYGVLVDSTGLRLRSPGLAVIIR